MSILGGLLTGRLILNEKLSGEPSVPHEAEAFNDLVQPILDLSLLCAGIHCMILSAGLTNGGYRRLMTGQWKVRI